MLAQVASTQTGEMPVHLGTNGISHPMQAHWHTPRTGQRLTPGSQSGMPHITPNEPQVTSFHPSLTVSTPGYSVSNCAMCPILTSFQCPSGVIPSSLNPSGCWDHWAIVFCVTVARSSEGFNYWAL